MKYFLALFMIVLPTSDTLAQTIGPNQNSFQPQARSNLGVIDIPISPFRKTVHISRIENKTIGLGQVMEPWESYVSLGRLPSPRFSYYSKNFVFNAEGGIIRGLDNGKSRKNRYLELGSETGIWNALLGAEGFIENEKVAGVITGIKLSSDFLRLSYGGKAWTGVRLGSFSKNFLAIRYGTGYIETEGNQVYQKPYVPLLVYREKFDTRSISAESKVRISRFVLAEGKLDKNWYRRVIYSPDPLKYGANRLEDLTLKASLEATPWPRHNMLRIVGKVTKNFQGTDRLLFRNDQPDLQIYLRIVFR